MVSVRQLFVGVNRRGVIIDEIHAIMAESLSECMIHLAPRYLIGLSATPTRPDGLDKLLDFYFGTDTKIVRELYHPHDVYKIDTGIDYEQESNNWCAMITEQCLHTKRNDLIVNIASISLEHALSPLT